MKCLSVIISYTTIHSWDTFVDLYNIACLLLDDKAPDNNKLAGRLVLLLSYSMLVGCVHR